MSSRCLPGDSLIKKKLNPGCLDDRDFFFEEDICTQITH
jgi:hypothetical protein